MSFGLAKSDVNRIVKNRRLSRVEPYRVFRTAVAKRDGRPVNILEIGDSLIEGAKVSTLEKRHVSLLRDQLRSYYPTPGVTGGRGYVCADYYAAGDGTLEAFTFTAGFSDTTGSDSKGHVGLGRRARVLSTATAAIAITQDCSSFDLIYKANTGGGTSVDVVIDGGAPTTVSTVDATGIDGKLWNSGALTPGSHTITVTRNAGTTYVEGIMFYNGDENAGIRMWEGGLGGARSFSFNAPDGNWIGCVKTTNADLVLIELGCNDWWYNSGVVSPPYGNYPPASVKSNIQTLITNVRGQLDVDPSIALVIAHARGDASVTPGQVPIDDWSEFVDAIYSIADDDPSIGIIDMNNELGPEPWVYGAPSVGLLDSDKVHINDYGSKLYADTIFRAITTGW